MNSMTPVPLPPFRKINWLPRDIAVERRADGVVVMQSRIPLAPYAPHIPSLLAAWAGKTPDNMWLAQRRGDKREWLKLSFGAAKRQVDSLTQALLDMKLPADRPIAILSGNSIEHALMTMAAMQARLPAAPVSPAYSLMSQDHNKLRYIWDLIRPSIVLVQDGPTFDKALAALDLTQTQVIHVARPPTSIQSRAFADLAGTPVTPAVAASINAITPDTVAKLLFTSGSTGMPKAVINTQRMMCANAGMMTQARPRPDTGEQPVFLDWMPWNHTMGGNAMFNPVLADGGALYIDDGRPQPGLFDETLKNLREISPSYFANVPAGYAMLAHALEHDAELAKSFFSKLSIMAYGGARLPDDLYERMQALAIKTTGERIVVYTGWGSTETGPTATATYWETERVGLIGLPFPGVQLKMVPVGPKYELRLKGIIVTPGYYGRPDLTEAMFDEEGFYKIGDAGTFVDPEDPAKGINFSGRVVEDFKLTTGTFVQVGSLRTDCIAAASPAINDALVAGQDRPYIGLLAWPNLEACRTLAGKPTATMDELVQDEKVIAHVRAGLARHNRDTGGSSMRISRVILLTEPPSIDGNELTDKGYINQRAGLERRASLVDALYAEPPGDGVIVVG